MDGSESSVAAEAVNVGNAIALRESLRALRSATRPLPVEARPRVLFNPDTRSANFFIPGLMVVMCQMMATLFAANAIVREKENGTLEQLFMTPVRPRELILGKMMPYLVLTFLEFCGIAVADAWSFSRCRSTARSSTLLAMALPFVLTMLGLGLWISTRANTRDAARQMVDGDGDAVDLPVGLRLPGRLDAVVLPVGVAVGPDDLADRRVPRRDPARRRLAGTVAARRHSLGHGDRRDRNQRRAVPQAALNRLPFENADCEYGRLRSIFCHSST